MRAFAYSFKDVKATITGPGGSIQIGDGAGVAEEGISYEPAEDKNTMTMGADGSVIHALNPVTAGKIIVRLLKPNPTNASLKQMYDQQTQSSILHGQNTVVITNVVTGDVISCRQVAFHKDPAHTMAKASGTIDWEFDAAKVHQDFGGAGLLLG